MAVTTKVMVLRPVCAVAGSCGSTCGLWQLRDRGRTHITRQALLTSFTVLTQPATLSLHDTLSLRGPCVRQRWSFRGPQATRLRALPATKLLHAASNAQNWTSRVTARRRVHDTMPECAQAATCVPASRTSTAAQQCIKQRALQPLSQPPQPPKPLRPQPVSALPPAYLKPTANRHQAHSVTCPASVSQCSRPGQHTALEETLVVGNYLASMSTALQSRRSVVVVTAGGGGGRLLLLRDVGHHHVSQQEGLGHRAGVLQRTAHHLQYGRRRSGVSVGYQLIGSGERLSTHSPMGGNAAARRCQNP